ncbi:MAG TPA: CamS family sex pheromone protein [Bacillota bacterium]
MMRKISVLLLSTLLVLASCAPSVKEDEIVKKDENKAEEPSIIPNYQLSKDNYKMILPYRPSPSRGVIVDKIANRMDIDEMEEGLRRHSVQYFDPEKYFFEEGQYLSEEVVKAWLSRKLTKKQLEREVKDEVEQLKKAEMTVNEEEIRAELQQGLNPPINDQPKKSDYEKSPEYLSHILEQNFLEKKDDNSVELVGVSLGIALKSVYRYQTEIGGPYHYKKISKEEMLEQGHQIAEEVVKRMRRNEELTDVPIMIALYREEEQSSPVPGNFVEKTFVEAGSKKIGKWKPIGEEYMLFPSGQGEKKYFDDNQLVESFGDEIAQYFPNYVGVVGEGFYVDQELKKLTLEVPIEFYGKGEVLGFTQYIYGLVTEMFKDYYDLEIKITSTEKMESFIFREAGEKEPTVHIFH